MWRSCSPRSLVNNNYNNNYNTRPRVFVVVVDVIIIITILRQLDSAENTKGRPAAECVIVVNVRSRRGRGKKSLRDWTMPKMRFGNRCGVSGGSGEFMCARALSHTHTHTRERDC